MAKSQASRRNNHKRNSELYKECRKEYYQKNKDKINEKARQRRKDNKLTACDIIKEHHDKLKDDPEHLTTEFIKKIINIEC